MTTNPKPLTRWRVPALAAALVTTLGAATALPLLPLRAQEHPAPAAPSATAPRAGETTATPIGPVSPQLATAASLGEAFSTVAERVSPSVVTLRVEAVQSAPQQHPFGGFFGMPFGGSDGAPRVMQGGGSGVIIRPDGLILTNNHVVQNAQRIDVVLRDGRVLRGEVAGTDPATDLAVVRVEATGLPAARFATSDDARVGEWVVAIGAPFGLDYTVTTGVLSAKGRGGLGANEIEDYLQTDASINPGNSGGPLVNLRGEVLGINTMILGRGAGIGFAIPSDLARLVANQIADHGEVRRAWIGVGFQELTPELASHFGTDHRGGALISHVVPNGPAARAGLRAGDVVVSVAGEAVRQSSDLLRRVIRTPVGQSMQVEYLRAGRSHTAQLRTGARPDSDRAAARVRADRDSVPSSTRDHGVRVQDLTPAIRRQIGYQGDGSVVVRSVASGSPAARAGLRPGDVIVEADRHPVRSSRDVSAKLADGQALLRVDRGEGSFFAVVDRD
jgi:Do/DeqQ family serine protease